MYRDPVIFVVIGTVNAYPKEMNQSVGQKMKQVVVVVVVVVEWEMFTKSQKKCLLCWRPKEGFHRAENGKIVITFKILLNGASLPSQLVVFNRTSATNTIHTSREIQIKRRGESNLLCPSSDRRFLF